MVLDQKEEWWWWPWGLGGRRGGGKEGRGERILAYDSGNRVSYDLMYMSRTSQMRDLFYLRFHNRKFRIW